MLELYELDAAYIDGYVAALDAVDAAGVATVIADVYPSTDNLSMILIGDAATIREAISDYGPVTELSISETRFRP